MNSSSSSLIISPHRIGGVDTPASGRTWIGPEMIFDAERLPYDGLGMSPRQIGLIAGRRFEALADQDERLAIPHCLIDLILVVRDSRVDQAVCRLNRRERSNAETIKVVTPLQSSPSLVAGTRL